MKLNIMDAKYTLQPQMSVSCFARHSSLIWNQGKPISRTPVNQVQSSVPLPSFLLFGEKNFVTRRQCVGLPKQKLFET